MTRTLWPARVAVGLMLVLQSASLGLLPVSPRTRGWMWTHDATLVVGIAVITGTAAWGFRRARVPLWLAGAMAVLLVALQHLQVTFHEAVPPMGEVGAMYAVAMVLWVGSIVDR
jgi:hypothetical protein